MSDLCWTVDRYRVTCVEPGEQMRMHIAPVSARRKKVPAADAHALRKFFAVAVRDPALVPLLIAGDPAAIETAFEEFVHANGLKFGGATRRRCDGCGQRVQWRRGEAPAGQTIDSGQFICRTCLDELASIS